MKKMTTCEEMDLKREFFMRTPGTKLLRAMEAALESEGGAELLLDEIRKELVRIDTPLRDTVI